jgi:hypothetical protein
MYRIRVRTESVWSSACVVSCCDVLQVCCVVLCCVVVRAEFGVVWAGCSKRREERQLEDNVTGQ